MHTIGSSKLLAAIHKQCVDRNKSAFYWGQLCEALHQAEESGCTVKWQAPNIDLALTWDGSPQGLNYWSTKQKELFSSVPGMAPVKAEPVVKESAFNSLTKGKLYVDGKVFGEIA